MPSKPAKVRLSPTLADLSDAESTVADIKMHQRKRNANFANFFIEDSLCTLRFNSIIEPSERKANVNLDALASHVVFLWIEEKEEILGTDPTWFTIRGAGTIFPPTSGIEMPYAFVWEPNQAPGLPTLAQSEKIKSLSSLDAFKEYRRLHRLRQIQLSQRTLAQYRDGAWRAIPQQSLAKRPPPSVFDAE